MPNLPGYAGSASVRIGNGASTQYQADVVGEVLVTLSAGRGAGIALRDRMRAEIDARGVAAAGHFTQHSGMEEVDASLLLLPQVGFCRPDDPRMLATVERIERGLMQDGLLRRYRTATGVDGLAGREHPFLACSFWLVEQYACTGRLHEARELMTRLCGLANDVGMLSEEHDVQGRRQAGNTPQAFSHLALVRAADALARARHKPR